MDEDSASVDKAELIQPNEQFETRPLASRLAASYQAIPALTQTRTLEEITEIAREEHAEEVARKGL